MRTCCLKLQPGGSRAVGSGHEDSSTSGWSRHALGGWLGPNIVISHLAAGFRWRLPRLSVSQVRGHPLSTPKCIQTSRRFFQNVPGSAKIELPASLITFSKMTKGHLPSGSSLSTVVKGSIRVPNKCLQASEQTADSKKVASQEAHLGDLWGVNLAPATY